MHHVALVVFAVLGLLTGGYFYCYHMLHIAVGNDLLLRVIQVSIAFCIPLFFCTHFLRSEQQSVTRNGRALLWVTALILIVIFIYSMVSFAFFRRHFDRDSGAFCQTAFEVQAFTF